MKFRYSLDLAHLINTVKYGYLINLDNPNSINVCYPIGLVHFKYNEGSFCCINWTNLR